MSPTDADQLQALRIVRLKLAPPAGDDKSSLPHAAAGARARSRKNVLPRNSSTAALTASLAATALAMRVIPASPTNATASLNMTDEERLHVLSAFDAAVPASAGGRDTVWARRQYAPMHIHRPALRQYREAIERAYPDHAITFDVIFASAENAVPWHADYDSLGPFDSTCLSIHNEDFITVHANLVNPAGEGRGALRTLDSTAVGFVHYWANRLTNSFGRLSSLTAPLARLGAVTHDSRPGVGNPFNNLKAHAVTAGAGRVSYVVRLVRRSVPLSAAKVRAAASGAASTRRIAEFEQFLPLLTEERTAVGDFPWARVGVDGAASH